MLSKNVVDLKLLLLWLVIGYALVAFVIYMSVTSVPLELDVSFPYQDKIFHTLAYFALMAWFGQIYHDKKRRYIFALIFIFMGAGLEYVQSFDPQRYSEFADMVANSAGVVLGFLLTLTQMKNCLLKVESMILK